MSFQVLRFAEIKNGFSMSLDQRFDNVKNGYFLLLSYARFLKPETKEDKVIQGTYRDAEQYIETRTDDFLYWTIKDMLDYIKLWCVKENDAQSQLILADLVADHASLPKMPHLLKCHFIRDTMMPMIELLIPQNGCYSQVKLKNHLESIQYVVGFELTWKSSIY